MRRWIRGWKVLLNYQWSLFSPSPVGRLSYRLGEITYRPGKDRGWRGHENGPLTVFASYEDALHYTKGLRDPWVIVECVFVRSRDLGVWRLNCGYVIRWFETPTGTHYADCIKPLKIIRRCSNWADREIRKSRREAEIEKIHSDLLDQGIREILKGRSYYRTSEDESALEWADRVFRYGGNRAKLEVGWMLAWVLSGQHQSYHDFLKGERDEKMEKLQG